MLTKRAFFRSIQLSALAAVAVLFSAPFAVPPGVVPEVTGFRFDTKTNFHWDPASGVDAYHVYRGLKTALPTSFGNCFTANVGPPNAQDLTANPALGQVFTYLVTATKAVNEGTMGFRTPGIERTNLFPCAPLPPPLLDTLNANGPVFPDGVSQGVEASRNPGILNDLNRLAAGGIYTHTGEYFVQQTDLEIPGRGISWRHVRAYRSQIDHNGQQGRNWTFNYDRRLRPDGGGGLLHLDGTGREDRYFSIGALWEPVDAGLYNKIRQTGTGDFELRERDGTIYTYHGFIAGPTSGRLESIQDRLGNRITFQYGPSGLLCSAVDTLGRSIFYYWSAQGRLAIVEDYSGRQVRYGYDVQGNLLSVTSPKIVGTSTSNDFPAGKTIVYTYSTGFGNPRLNHNLLTVTAPGDPVPYITNSYNPDDEVFQQFAGGLNGSGVFAGGVFNYVIAKPGGMRQTTVTDRRGAEHVFDSDLSGHVTREEAMGLQTFHSYNPAGERTNTQLPEGNRLEYGYDDFNGDRFQRGNLVYMVRTPDFVRGDGFGGFLPSIVVQYQYEPIGTQQRTIQDPAGGLSEYTYDYQEGDPNLNGVNALVADWQINLGPTPLLVGDVNTDGITSHAFGNPVQLRQPSVNLLPGGRQQAIEGGPIQPIVTRYRHNAHGQILVEVDPENNVKTYAYFAEVDPDGDGVSSPAPLDGRVLDPVTGGYLRIAIVDDDPVPYLTPVEVARRDNAQSPAPTKIQNDFGYDRVGNLTSSIDGNGNLTTFEVNARGQVVSVRRGAISYRSTNFDPDPPPNGVVSRQMYNARDEIVLRQVQDLGDLSGTGGFIDTLFEYDLLGDMVRLTQEAGFGIFNQTTYSYDAQQNRIGVRLPAGNQHTMSHDARGLLTAVTRGDFDLDAANAPPPGTSQQTYQYDGNGNPRVFVDGRGQPWGFTYDGLDRRVRGEVVPGSSFFDVTYTPTEAIQRIVVRDGLGTILYDANYLYDQIGRITRMDQAILSAAGAPINESADGDHITSMVTEYDRNSRRSRVLNDSSALTDFDHDGAGRMVNKRDSLGNRAVLTYDDNANPLTVLDVDVGPVGTENYSSTSAFDRLNRLKSTTDAAGNVATFGYDSRDNQILLRDKLGNTTSYAYDAMNRRTRITRDLRAGGTGAGAVIDQITHTFEYDPNGRLGGVLDPKGHETRYAYDALDRKIEDRFDDDTTIEYSFDANDNVIRVKDANGSMITIAYDVPDRPISRVVAAAPGTHAIQQSFAYDGFNRLVSAADQNDQGPSEATTLTFQYDSLNHVRQEGSRFGANPIRTFTYNYDGNGNRRTATYPFGGNRTYSYDAMGRLSSIADGVSAFNVLYGYLGPERIAERRHGNGTRKSYLNPAGVIDIGYDNLKRVRAVRHYDAGGAIQAGFDYTRDVMGNIQRDVRLHNAGVQDQYMYDSAYRVVSFNRDVGGASPQNVQYTLDRVGNWVQRIVNGTPFGYTPNNLNEYDENQAGGVRVDDGLADDTEDNLLTGIFDGRNQGHDANGDLTVDGTKIYEYDALHRLVFVRDDPPGPPPATLVAHYVYDALNRRIARIDNTTGQRFRYAYDSEALVSEVQLSNLNIEGAPLRRFQRGVNQELVATQRLTVPVGLFYLHDDVRGSLVMATSTAAVIQERVTYDENGTPRFENSANVPTGATESLFTPFLHGGRFWDRETQLYEERGAMYAPRLGRHLQRMLPGQHLGPLAAALNPPMFFPVPTNLMGMNPFWWCKGWFWRVHSWFGGWWAWFPCWWWGSAWGWWWWSPWMWVWGTPFFGWWCLKPWWFWWGGPFRWWGWPTWWNWPGWWGFWPWWGWFGWGGWLPSWGWLGWGGWWPWWGWWGWTGWWPLMGWWGWYGWWPFWNTWWSWHPWWWWGWWTWSPWWWWSGYWSWSGLFFWWNWSWWLGWWPWGWWNWLPWHWWWGWWGWNPWFWWGWWGWWWWGWVRGWHWWAGGWPWWAWYGWGWWGWWWKGWWAWSWSWGWWAWWWGWWWPWWAWGWGWWPWWAGWWWRWPWWGWFNWWGWWWPWWGWWW